MASLIAEHHKARKRWPCSWNDIDGHMIEPGDEYVAIITPPSTVITQPDGTMVRLGRRQTTRYHQRCRDLKVLGYDPFEAVRSVTEQPVRVVEVGGRKGLPLRPLPDFLHYQAANGHKLVARVTGVRMDGTLQYSQHDAEHDVTCPCGGEELPDW